MITSTGLQIIMFSRKDMCPTKSSFWSDKTKMRSAIIQYCLISEPANLTHCQCRVNYSLHLAQNALYNALAFALEGKQKLSGHLCPTTVGISSDIGKFGLAIVRWPTVICSPASIYRQCISFHFILFPFHSSLFPFISNAFPSIPLAFLSIFLAFLCIC